MTHTYCDNCDNHASFQPIYNRWLCNDCTAELDDTTPPKVIELPTLDNIAQRIGL